MHTFVIAEHPEFGKIRTVEKDGKIWFCAKDVAASLGYANTRDAIDRHCKQKGVCVHDIPTRGGRQKIKFIDEGNMYRLIAGSRLPSAERFESWQQPVPSRASSSIFIIHILTGRVRTIPGDVQGRAQVARTRKEIGKVIINS